MRTPSWGLGPLALALVGCGSAEAALTLQRPDTLRGLEGAPIEASVDVYREAGGCQGKVVESQALEERDGAFVGTLHLRPGRYHFCVLFASQGTDLGRYVDLPLDVEQGADQDLALDPARFRYRDLDADGDGIANLDEVRFGFDLHEDDLDSSARVAFTFSGTFAMGAADAAATVVERPVHDQPIEPFAIDRLEVSIERYRLCAARALDPCAPPVGTDLFSFMNQDAAARRLPVTGITLDDARRFCTSVAGGALPGEEQWEYAARSTGTLYPWGDAPPEPGQSRCGWLNARYYAGSSTSPCQGDPAARLVAVDHFDVESPDLRGCALPGEPDGARRPCQLAGNAWEWTTSRFTPYPGESWSPPAGELYVVRGGSADSLDHSLRATFRFGVTADLAGSDALAPFIGFRCVYPGP